MNASKFANRIVADERGTVAIMFGLSAVILMALAGIAIDGSRGLNVKMKVQEALDAAALAAARTFDEDYPTITKFEKKGKAYFEAQLKDLGVGRVKIRNLQIIPDYDEFSVTASADVKVKTYFGFASDNVSSFDFTPVSKVVYKPKKIELSMVLDITGSMCDVPPATATDACSSAVKLDALKAAANSLVDSLVATGPTLNSIKVSVVPYSAAVNAGSFAGVASGWHSSDGCVVERTGAHAYTDAPPSWAHLGVTNVTLDPVYSCPASPILPLTDIADNTKLGQIRSAISGLKGFGGTAGHLGAAWGWYTVSPAWNGVWPGGSQPRDYDPDRIIKVVVLMTDGMFNASYEVAPENQWPNAAANDPTIPGTSGFQALKVCQEMQKSGKEVRVYAIGFQTTPEAEALLRQCSGTDNFYAADSAAELIDAFKTIAENLAQMRVSG